MTQFRGVDFEKRFQKLSEAAKFEIQFSGISTDSSCVLISDLVCSPMPTSRWVLSYQTTLS